MSLVFLRCWQPHILAFLQDYANTFPQTRFPRLQNMVNKDLLVFAGVNEDIIVDLQALRFYIIENSCNIKIK